MNRTPKFVFNHVCLECREGYCIYPKLDKRIPKTVDCYGENGCIGKGQTIDEAIHNSGVPVFDVQVIV